MVSTLVTSLPNSNLTTEALPSAVGLFDVNVVTMALYVCGAMLVVIVLTSSVLAVYRCSAAQRQRQTHERNAQIRDGLVRHRPHGRHRHQLFPVEFGRHHFSITTHPANGITSPFPNEPPPVYQSQLISNSRTVGNVTALQMESPPAYRSHETEAVAGSENTTLAANATVSDFGTFVTASESQCSCHSETSIDVTGVNTLHGCVPERGTAMGLWLGQ